MSLSRRPAVPALRNLLPIGLCSHFWISSRTNDRRSPLSMSQRKDAEAQGRFGLLTKHSHRRRAGSAGRQTIEGAVTAKSTKRGDGHLREDQTWPERHGINRVMPAPRFATPLALSVVEGTFVFDDWMIRCADGDQVPRWPEQARRNLETVPGLGHVTNGTATDLHFRHCGCVTWCRNEAFHQLRD
jgi:hypothetical protein